MLQAIDSLAIEYDYMIKIVVALVMHQVVIIISWRITLLLKVQSIWWKEYILSNLKTVAQSSLNTVMDAIREIALQKQLYLTDWEDYYDGIMAGHISGTNVYKVIS